LLFTREGWNAKQVQLQLGHHSPAFTLATYIEVLPDDLPTRPGWQRKWQQDLPRTAETWHP
jgi:hypothetical protein